MPRSHETYRCMVMMWIHRICHFGELYGPVGSLYKITFMRCCGHNHVHRHSTGYLCVSLATGLQKTIRVAPTFSA